MNHRPSRWSLRALRLAFKQARNAMRKRRRDRRFVRRAREFEQRFADVPLGPAPPGDGELAFLHAGNAGDIIFSLPALRAIAGARPARYLIEVGAPASYEGPHPLGNLRLNAALAGMLVPLLEFQSYIAGAAIHAGEPVDYRLDLFREAPLPGDKGYLARWYFYTFAVNWDLSQPWITAPPDPAFADAIVLARSARYRNPLLDHRFLARFPRVVFIGVEDEFADMRALLPRLEYHRVQDCLQMASAIAGARLFVGNQSLPYSIGEALKVPRVLEACYRAPTNVPEGPDGHDCYFQRHFEFVVERLYARAT